MNSRCQLGNAVVVGKKIYFTAGQDGSSGSAGYADSSHIYEIDPDDPSTATDIGYLFTTSADMRGTSVVAAGSKLYARHGGSAAEGSVPYTDWMEIFDLDTKVLTRHQITISKGGVSRHFMPGINIGKYIYWFGGTVINAPPTSFITTHQVDYAQRYNIETGEFDFVTVGSHMGVYINSSMLTNVELLFSKYESGAPLYKFKGAYELENGKLFIQEGFLDNTWDAVKGKDWDLKVGVSGVFLGGANGYAQAEDAYLYDSTQQKWISLNGTSFDGEVTPTPLPELAGTWKFNTSIYPPENTFDITSNYSIASEPPPYDGAYTRIYISNNKLMGIATIGATTEFYDFATDTPTSQFGYFRTDSVQNFTDEFHTWLASNATKQ